MNFAPAVREAAELLAGKAAVAQVNTDENPGLASRYGVRGIPVIMLLRDGAAVDQLVGAHPARAVADWFHRHQKG